MEEPNVSLPSARRADHLGWFAGLVVCSATAFGLTLVYILAFEWPGPHFSHTWADHVTGLAWSVQAPLAFWGLVGTIRAAWHRRFGRTIVWLLVTVWVLLLLIGGSFLLFVFVIRGAPSVGEPPPDSPEGREMARADSLYSSPGFQEKRRHD